MKYVLSLLAGPPGLALAVPAVIWAYLHHLATQIWLSILAVALCILLLSYAHEWPSPVVGPDCPDVGA